MCGALSSRTFLFLLSLLVCTYLLCTYSERERELQYSTSWSTHVGRASVMGARRRKALRPKGPRESRERYISYYTYSLEEREKAIDYESSIV